MSKRSLVHLKVNGVCKYRYRAVDKQERMIDFMLRLKRDRSVAGRCLEEGMRQNGDP